MRSTESVCIGSYFTTDVQKVGRVPVRVVAIYVLQDAADAREATTLYRVERVDRKVVRGPRICRLRSELHG